MRFIPVLVGVAALAGLWYAALCAYRPLVRCRSCHGLLVRPRRGPRALARLVTIMRGPATCRRCRGVGTTIRLGRRAYNHVRAIQRAGSR